jgi:hypothetical protein
MLIREVVVVGKDGAVTDGGFWRRCRRSEGIDELGSMIVFT